MSRAALVTRANELFGTGKVAEMSAADADMAHEMPRAGCPAEPDGPDSVWANKRARQAAAREQVARGERSPASCFLIPPALAQAATVVHRVLAFDDDQQSQPHKDIAK